MDLWRGITRRATAVWFATRRLSAIGREDTPASQPPLLFRQRRVVNSRLLGGVGPSASYPALGALSPPDPSALRLIAVPGATFALLLDRPNGGAIAVPPSCSPPSRV